MVIYDYLIIGGGMTAAAAVQGIREVDAQGTIGLIGAEHHRPYNRPPLSKKLWQGKPEDSIWRNLTVNRLDLILGHTVKSLDPLQRQVELETGGVYSYRRLLLATGGRPRRLHFGPREANYFRTVDDYHTVRSWMGRKARIGIIGGGFIGTEIAAALASNGEKAVLAFPSSSLGAHLYPPDLAQYLTDYYREKGVELHPGSRIDAIERHNGGFLLRAQHGKTIPVDHLIVGIGLQPNVELAQSAGIQIAGAEAGGGVLVDGYLRTSHPGIFAAGDVASFHNLALGKTMRVEHEDNANQMGRTAGMNMAGRETVYDHQPYFYSDLFDLGYEAVGELDSRLQTVSEWKVPFREGVVYYLKENKIRGVLLWNTWGKVDAARRLIAGGEPFRPEALAAHIPEG